MNPLSTTLLTQAYEAAEEVLRFAQPADAVLSAYFRHKRCGPRERAFIAETIWAVLRHKRSLTAWLGSDEARALTLAALVQVRGFGLRMFEGAVGKDDLKWLRALKARPQPELSLAEHCELPDWLVDRLLPYLGESELLALSRGLNRNAPLDLRVNILKASRNEVLTDLAQSGIAAQPGPLAPQAVRLTGKPAINEHPLFLEGKIEVQDEGSQLLAHLLAPRRGEMVADFCAGSGGKTLALGALMRSTGRLYAFEVNAARLKRMKPRLARSGLSNVHPVLIADENDARLKRLAGKFDRVLVDAPCSGLGTLRRNPDLKWRQTPQAVDELAAKQARILAASSRLLKPGGRLVYATCSILDEENQAVVDAFLAHHPEFRRLDAVGELARQGVPLSGSGDLCLLPHLHGCDGFYAALLEREA